MRWSGQQVGDDGVGGDAALPGLRGLLRSVRTPDFAGTVFHEVEAKSMLNRVPGGSPMPFSWTVNPYRGCSHACVYCLDGATRVLLADGRTRPIAELGVGDAVLGTETGPDGVRRYVRTEVLAHWGTDREGWEVELSDGTRLVTSGEHRFLTERGWRHVAPGWCRSGRRPHLRAGETLLGPGAPVEAPEWTPGYRAGYLCGVARADAAHPAAHEGETFPSERLPLETLARLHRMVAAAADPGLPENHAADEVPVGVVAAGASVRSGLAGLPRDGSGPTAVPAGRCGPGVPGPERPAASGSARPASAGRPAPAGPGRWSRVRGEPGVWSPVPSRPAAGPRVRTRGPGREGEESGPRRVPLPAGGGVRAGAGVPAGPSGWPLRPGLDWCAGFVAGVLDAAGVRTADGLVVRVAGVRGRELVEWLVSAGRGLGLRFAASSTAHGGIDGGRRGGLVEAVLPGDARTVARLVGRVDPTAAAVRDMAGAVVAQEGAQVVAVRELGTRRPMFDITTGTGDFVAEGVISHNCFARNTHTYLDLDAGADFDSQIVVKVNAARVLDRELRRPRWRREPVAMGTNTDPYQRAEGRYRLMPGILRALAGTGTPFSVLTKGTVLTRDLPDIAAAADDVPVGLGVSIALLDEELHSRLEPGAPSPRARLDLVRRITDAGLPCGVMVAPVLPFLTDSAEALDAVLERIAAAGATGATVLALHLRPGTREWFLQWLAREHPGLVERYAQLYRRGAYVDADYRRALGERVTPLLRRHGLDRPVTTMRLRGRTGTPDAGAGRDGEQLSLL
nr:MULTISPECIES: intein-containing Rv2578c family radical SAM protein [unclassified Pseudonocardia]